MCASRNGQKPVYETMQPGLPPESPSMGVEDVGSISEVLEAVENRVAKKSIGSVER